MHKQSAGFTLVELLVVIAIIGILCAVMLPNLLGARAAAAKRSVQIHSANVYKALVADLSDASYRTVSDVVNAYGSDCKPSPVLNGGRRYGWSAAPGSVANCQIAAGGQDFQIAATGDATTNNYVSVNGNPGS